MEIDIKETTKELQKEKKIEPRYKQVCPTCGGAIFKIFNYYYECSDCTTRMMKTIGDQNA